MLPNTVIVITVKLLRIHVLGLRIWKLMPGNEVYLFFIFCFYISFVIYITFKLFDIPFTIMKIDTAGKVSKYGVFPGPYFPAFGLILRTSPYLVRMRENTDQKNLLIWTLFAQCENHL